MDWFKFYGMNFASPASPLAGADGGGSSAPPPSGGAPSGGSGGGAPVAPASTPAVAPHPADSGNIAQLRAAYDTLKSQYNDISGKYKPWEGVQYKPEQVGQFSTVYERVFSESKTIAESLGYTEAEVQEALLADPIKTLDFLRNEAYQAEQGQGGQQDPNQDLNAQIQSAVEAHMGPIQQRENQRITSEANQLFERSVHGFIAQDFKQLGLDVGQADPSEIEMLMTATSEIMKYDEAALKGLKYEGKVAPIQKCYEQAKTYLDKYFLARTARENRRAAPGGQGSGRAPSGNGDARKPSLDEMIADPSVIGSKYK